MAAPPVAPVGQRPVQVLYLALGVAAALFVGRAIPYGFYLLYPFTLFATWVHEMGHATAALALGGHVDALHIFASAGGDAVVTWFQSWRDGAVCAAGMIAPPFVGAALVLVARTPRRATIVLGGFALVVGATTLLWVRSLFGGLVLALLALALGWLALRAGPRTRYFVAQFLGVELGLDWIARIDYFFSSGFDRDGAKMTSDVATLASATGNLLPYWVWGGILAALSCLILMLAVRITLRRDGAADA